MRFEKQSIRPRVQILQEPRPGTFISSDGKTFFKEIITDNKRNDYQTSRRKRNADSRLSRQLLVRKRRRYQVITLKVSPRVPRRSCTYFRDYELRRCLGSWSRQVATNDTATTIEPIRKHPRRLIKLHLTPHLFY